MDHRAEAAGQRQSRIGTPLKWRSCGAERPIGKAGAQGVYIADPAMRKRVTFHGSEDFAYPRGRSSIFRAGTGLDTGRGEAARGSRFGKALLNECQWVMLTVSHGDAVRFGQANKSVPVRGRLPSPART
ncbi:hypothetical protein KUTG_05650 [Kutzneria sp. 744]|nr:hypothetical protein KUTG_05650 [Kutzneria sp. 744]